MQFEFKGSLLAEFLLAWGKGQSVLFRPSIDWMSPTPTAKGNQLYSESTDLNAFFFFFSIYLFRLHQVLVAARGIFSCGMRDLLVVDADFLVAACMRDLVPQPEIEPGPPALGAWSLTHWTTREVPNTFTETSRPKTPSQKHPGSCLIKYLSTVAQPSGLIKLTVTRELCFSS